MLTLLNRFSKYSIVILGFLAITLSHAQDERADDISILDVDANGEVDALTDGLLLLRSMFGLTDEALATGVIDLTNCTECDAEGIDSYIASVKGATYGKLNANDDQNISGSGLDGTTLTIGIEGGSSETVDLSSLEDGNGITADQASAIAANTAKTGITSGQTSAITANTAKTGITSGQASAITANTAKTVITSGQASAITANTAKTGITSGQASAITANTAKTGITSGQASAITANTAKTGITSGQASAITANTAKTGITSGQASAITANTAKTGITSGQASAITANTAKTGITSGQASAIELNTAKTVLTLGTSSSTALAGDALSGTVNIGQTDAMTTVKGTLNVDQAVTLDTTLTVAANQTSQLGGDVTVKSSIDTISAGALELGKATATSVNIADAGVTTDIQGPVTVQSKIDTGGSNDLLLGTGNATNVYIANGGATTTIIGPLRVNGSHASGTSLYVRTSGPTLSGSTVIEGDARFVGTVGFFGNSPVSRSAIAGIDNSSCAAVACANAAKINELISALKNLGLIN